MLFTANAIIYSRPHHRYHLDLPGRFVIDGLGSSAGLFGQLCQAFKEYGCLNVYEQPDALLIVDGCGTVSTSIRSTDTDEQRPWAYPNPAIAISPPNGEYVAGWDDQSPFAANGWVVYFDELLFETGTGITTNESKVSNLSLFPNPPPQDAPLPLTLSSTEDVTG